MQATLLSKLDSIETRVQVCETHLLHHPHSSIPPTSSQDPKGKAPMVSPLTSPTSSPAPTPHIPSPQPSPSAQKTPPHDPVPVPSDSSHSSSSSRSDSQQFELAARTPTTPAQSPASHSVDSETTPSDPTRYLTPPPSPPSPPPPPPPPPPTSPSLSSPSPRAAPMPYRRSKMAVLKPGFVTPPPPQ